MNKEYTIITVTFNCKEKIEKTIQSVITQQCKSIEYIIIDGGSTDGTLEIINKYDSYITKLISEPDHGIYDAMNKGLALASGKWINFMNAGDIFASKNVISDLFSETPNENVLCVYGDHYLSKNNILELRRSCNPKTLTSKIAFCHQASFIRNINVRFRSDLKICADFALFRDLYEKHGEQAFLKRNVIVSINDDDGMSSKQNRKRRAENISIISQYTPVKGFLARIRFYIAIILHRI